MNGFMWKVCDFLMFVAVILIIGLFIWLVHQNNKEKQSKLISDSYEQGYLDACKDFYKGKLKYELVKNDDGTVEWKKIKEDKNN